MKFSALGTMITELPFFSNVDSKAPVPSMPKSVQPLTHKTALPLKMTLPRRVLSVLAKVFDKLEIHGESYVNSLVRKQYKKAAIKNEYPELDWLDLEKAKKKKKRKADLERIERYKTSGM